ncbi:MAG TPA: hypothetical protein VKQ36_03190 [Ktedonobacterales bacterium]|nr:hypothetical protein [Ktedonobacterales bacterium]
MAAAIQRADVTPVETEPAPHITIAHEGERNGHNGHRKIAAETLGDSLARG